jgi:hypothetical protein
MKSLSKNSNHYQTKIERLFYSTSKWLLKENLEWTHTIIEIEVDLNPSEIDKSTHFQIGLKNDQKT